MTAQPTSPSEAHEALRETHRDRATGEFGRQPRSGPIDLPPPDAPLSLVSLHGTGTFDFPGVFSNADELIKFWTTVDIPDRALGSTKLAHEQRWERALADTTREFEASHGPLPVGRPMPEFNAYIEARERYYEENLYSHHLVKGIPRVLGVQQVRPLVIATKMWASARALPEAERNRVHNLPVTFPDHDQRNWTIATLVGRWRSHEIESQMNEWSMLRRQDR